jgi:hypothetical protein
MALTNGSNLGLLINGDIDEEHYVELMKQWRGFDGLVQCVVKDKDLTAPPGGAANGDCYIPAAGATGLWAGLSGKVVRYFTVGTGAPAWEAFTPKAGWIASVQDELVGTVPARYGYSGSVWVKLSGTASSVDLTTSPTDTTPNRAWRTDDLVKTTSQTDATTGRMLSVGYAGQGLNSSTSPPSFSPTSLADMVASISGKYRNTTTATLNSLITAGTAPAMPPAIVASKMQYDGSNSVYPWHAAGGSARAGFLSLYSSASQLRNVEFWTNENLVKTASSTDGTTGSMLKVGDGALLGNTVSISDINALTVTASYNAGGGATGLPVAIASMVDHKEIAGGNATQLIICYGASIATNVNRVFVRHKDGGVWEAPHEFWTTSNTSANVQTMLGAADNAAIRAAVDSSVFPVYTFATKPLASANTNKGIIISDLTGGREPCWSDGTDWRRASDRSIAS